MRYNPNLSPHPCVSLPGSAPTPIPRYLFVLSLLANPPPPTKKEEEKKMPLSASFFSLAPHYPKSPPSPAYLKSQCPPSGSILVSIPFPPVASHCALSGNSREHRLGSLTVRPLRRKWWAVEPLGCQMRNGFSTRCLRPPWPLPQT